MEKQPKLLLKYAEGMTKEKSTLSEGIEELSSREQLIERIVEAGGATMVEIKIDGKMNKTEGDENSNDRSKSKKVVMPVFSGIDLDSWLFRVDR